MNKLIHVKHVVVLMFVFGIVPLSAMRNQQTHRGLRLTEQKRLAQEIQLDERRVAHRNKLEEERRLQAAFAYDGGCGTVLQPVDAAKFRNLVESTNSNVEEEDQGNSLDTVMLRPVTAGEFAKVIAREQKDWKK